MHDQVDAGRGVSAEDLGAGLGCSDGQPPGELLGWPVQHRGQPREGVLALTGVVGHLGPHGRQHAVEALVGSVVRRQGRRQLLAPGGDLLGRRVVRRREPAVAEPGDAAQPGIRPPAPDPDGRTAGAGRARLQDLGRRRRRLAPGGRAGSGPPRRTVASAPRSPPRPARSRPATNPAPHPAPAGLRTGGPARRPPWPAPPDRARREARPSWPGSGHRWPRPRSPAPRSRPATAAGRPGGRSPRAPGTPAAARRVRTTRPRPPASPARRSRSAAGARRTPCAERTREYR